MDSSAFISTLLCCCCRIKQTGEIYVSKPMDRESITEYHLEVSATDGVFVSSIMVLIVVLDDNDNPPVCERVSWLY